mgnify:CR=1 FL=1
MSKKTVVVSGIRATGRLHLGNYLGVLERFATMSRDPTKTCFFFIADMHTMTTQDEATLIRKHAPDIILDMLAAGVDPDTATIYVQSQAPVVAELAWYLACLTSYGDMTRMPTFKDKAAKHPENVNAGLFLYPVLMAADILGPHANLVPVGEDQRPHLELARQTARIFNRRYGNYFPIPGDLGDDMLSVPGLVAADASGQFGKMGKSEKPGKTIFLADPVEEIGRKISRAPTDPARIHRSDPGTPSKCAIFALHGLISSEQEVTWSANGCRTATISCRECKEVLANNVTARLAAFNERRRDLVAKKNHVDELIHEGGRRAREVFANTAAHVANAMGVYR